MTRSLVVACLVLATALIVQHADAVDSLRRLSKAHKASRAQAEAQVDASTTVSLQRVAIDPRVFDLEESVARPTNFLQWEVGQRYVYRFTSKAAHMSTPLPAPDRVNPQIALEDLGLFPFAVLEGTLTLSSICMLDDRTVTFEATITRTRVDCGEDSLRPNSTCPHLYGVGRALTANPFWFTMNPRGEIISMDFSVADDEELSGIKRNMVHELALTMPEKNENAALFARYQRRGATNFATRYRIRPFTRRSAFDSAIDGLIVRKERALSRPSRADREIGTEPAVYHRFTWVYMVIGGEVDARAGAAAVPTRLSALEQTQVDPLILAQRNASSVGSLYILSRLELNLRNVLPGVDNTTDLRKFIQVPTNETVMVNITGNVTNQTVWVNGTQQICTVPLKPRAPDAPAPTGPELKHYEPTPALSFLETAASATSAVNHLEVVPESMTLENAQDDLHAALYEESALRAWM